MSDRYDWSAIRDMHPADKIEHLKWLVEELTTPPPEYAIDGLTRQESRVFGLLLKRKGEIVPQAAILAAAAGEHRIDDWPDDTKIVHVLVHKIRRKLTQSGVSIETVYGLGYRATMRGAS